MHCIVDTYTVITVLVTTLKTVLPTWPPMHQQQRQDLLPLGLDRVRLGVDEMEVDAIDAGLEVIEGVELLLLIAPVVLIQPVVAKDLGEKYKYNLQKLTNVFLVVWTA